jgi:hypothetical protein
VHNQALLHESIWCGGVASCSLSPGTRRRGIISFLPRSFYSQRHNEQHTLQRTLREPQVSLNAVKRVKSLMSAGNRSDSLFLRTVAIHYTDCALLAPTKKDIMVNLWRARNWVGLHGFSLRTIAFRLFENTSAYGVHLPRDGQRGGQNPLSAVIFTYFFSSPELPELLCGPRSTSIHHPVEPYLHSPQVFRYVLR